MTGGTQNTMVVFKFMTESLRCGPLCNTTMVLPSVVLSPPLGTMACRASLFRPPTLPLPHLHSQVMALLLVKKIEVIRKETPHVSAPTRPHLSASVPALPAFSPSTVDKFLKKHLGTSAPALPPITRSLLLKDMAAVTFHSFLQHQLLPVPSHFHAHGSMQ